MARALAEMVRRGLAPALLLKAIILVDAAAGTLSVTDKAGEELARIDATAWCIVWNHSVKGFAVQDCYELHEDRMVLVRSHQPDFAAGLGHIPGRGRQTSDDRGGYWIEDIDEVVPGNCYRLRVGSASVDHRIVTGNRKISLSALAAGESVAIRAGKAMKDSKTC